MAEKLNDFNFFRGRPGGPSKYQRYLDGGIYRLAIPGDLPSAGSIATLRRLAKENGMKLRTTAEGRSAVVVQAYTEDD
jgi:hypothetical protein